MNLGAFQPGQAAALPTSTIELAVRFVNEIFLYSRNSISFTSAVKRLQTRMFCPSRTPCVFSI